MISKLKQTREQVEEKLACIPKRKETQVVLRRIFWTRLIHNLSEQMVPKQTANEVPEGCVCHVKNGYPDFEFQHDPEFLN